VAARELRERQQATAVLVLAGHGGSDLAEHGGRRRSWSWPGTAGSSGHGGSDLAGHGGELRVWRLGGAGVVQDGVVLASGGWARSWSWPAADLASGSHGQCGRWVEREWGFFFFFLFFLDFLVDLIGGS
jgi:hypothetical protein